MAENGGGKRPRLSLPAEIFVSFDDCFDDDSSEDSSYHPDKGELQEFQREIEAKVTRLVKSVRDSELSLTDFQRQLVDRISTTQPVDHDFLVTELRFSMANAIQFKKWSLLTALIDCCPPHLLSEVFSSGGYPLLNFAIKITSVDGVGLLLERGAHSWSDFSASSLDTIISAIEDAFDYEYFTEATARSFLEIFRLLFKFNANPAKCPRLANQIAAIAGRSPEIASLLLEKIPASCYLPRMSSIEGSRIKSSPLFNAFEAMNSWDPINALENMFTYGILPMIKNGAPLCPVDDMLLTNLPPAHNLIALDKRCSVRLWKHPFAVTRIVIEARQTSALNVTALRKALPVLERDADFDGSDESDGSGGVGGAVNNHDGVGSSRSSSEDDSEGVEECRHLVEFLRSQFPRRLQEISRTAILRALPSGRQRSEVIKTLDIPSSLISYLLLQDLNMPSMLNL